MTLANREDEDGALTVAVAGQEPTVRPANSHAPTSQLAQVSNTAAVQANAPQRDSGSSSSSLNKAVSAISVIMATAMIAVLYWYWRERRSDRDRDRLRANRLGTGQSLRSVLPLQTSFHPSMKSSFDFTGASPDSPWSRTTGTITPLTRAAGQENLFSPLSQTALVQSPLQGQSNQDAGLPPPPVTANTSRTFRTSIRSMMVNRDSATIGHASLANDFFPLSPSANGRPRLTRLPSYHTEYTKMTPYVPTGDEKRGLIPGPDTGTGTGTVTVTGTDTTSPADYTSTLPHSAHSEVPPLPTAHRAPSELTLPTPTPTTATFAHPRSKPKPQTKTPTPKPTTYMPSSARTPKNLPAIRTALRTRVRESELEYLNGAEGTPSSAASRRVLVNSSEPPLSARQSVRGDSLSEDLRGLLFLGSSVTVNERRVNTGPADPDLSPTRGWSRLPEVESGRRLV